MHSIVSKEMKRFNYLLSEIDSAYHEVTARLGISDSAMQILYTICDSDDPTSCPLQEICRRTGISKQTIHSAIHKLESEGIVYLTQSNGRQKIVHLTEAGQRLAERTALRIIEVENALLRAWSDEDVRQYLSLTERFLRDFRAQTQAIVLQASPFSSEEESQ